MVLLMRRTMMQIILYNIYIMDLGLQIESKLFQSASLQVPEYICMERRALQPVLGDKASLYIIFPKLGINCLINEMSH